MGWVSSPPFFCSLTESVADVANDLLKDNQFYPLAHPLVSTADAPSAVDSVVPVPP
jgi:hypothetical protein